MIHTEIHYYLDDGIIASPTFEQHLVTLRKMFERLTLSARLATSVDLY